MGIRFLNRLIQSRCPDAISRIHFEQLRGKNIAVDISIYIYRFIAEGALLEKMYLMASIFRHYDINAIFVFDGPPPIQKTEVIEIRKRKKDAAKRQFSEMETLLKKKKAEPRIDTHEIIEIEETMTQLKKQFIHIRDNDINNVKDLLVSFGFTIVDAEGEADALCAKLSIKKRVFACMSDDTDMFVYGCPNVLRHISLLNHSAVCYNMSTILESLELTQEEFKMVCIVNGTDYSAAADAQEYVTNSASSSPVAKSEKIPDKIPAQNYSSPMIASGETTISHTNRDSTLRIFKVYNLLMEFKRLGEREKKKYEMGFYEWLEIKKKFTSSVISLITNEAMFDLSKAGSSAQYKQLVILNRKDIHKRRIVEIMMKEDFIFIESNPGDLKIISSLSRGSGTITSSPVYGVGVWNETPHSASVSSASSASSASSIETKIKSINAKMPEIDAALAVEAVDIENRQELALREQESQEYKASILATEVYGFDAKTMHELKKQISISKPRQIKSKKNNNKTPY
jgi:hypothetical protein